MSIAFCFLLYDKVEHGELWESFFIPEHENHYNIYSHLKEVNNNTQQWIKENAIKSIPTAWGDFSLLKASMLLFKEALKNKNNEYFVLLSGADIPLHNFEKIYSKITKDNKSHLDIRFNKEYDVWGASQWMYLSRDSAKQLCRLLNSKDKVAKKFLDFWIPETDPNGEEDCHICEIYGADETIPVNWFIHLYGKPNSKNFKSKIQNSTVTYAYFKTRYTQSPAIWTSKTLTPYRIWEMSKCLFGRKYTTDAVQKLVNYNYKFTKKQLETFKERKKIDGKKAHWGQPTK